MLDSSWRSSFARCQLKQAARRRQLHSFKCTFTELPLLFVCIWQLFSPQPGSLEAALASEGLNAPLSTLEHEEALRDQASKAVEHRQLGRCCIGEVGCIQGQHAPLLVPTCHWLATETSAPLCTWQGVPTNTTDRTRAPVHAHNTRHACIPTLCCLWLARTAEIEAYHAALHDALGELQVGAGLGGAEGGSVWKLGGLKVEVAYPGTLNGGASVHSKGPMGAVRGRLPDYVERIKTVI